MINQKCTNCGKEDGYMEYAMYHHRKKRVYCSEKCFKEGVKKYLKEKEAFCLSNYLLEINSETVVGKSCIKKYIEKRNDKLIRIQRLESTDTDDWDIALNLVRDLIRDKDNLIGDKFR